MASDAHLAEFPGADVTQAVFQDSVASSLLPEHEQVQEAWGEGQPGRGLPRS